MDHPAPASLRSGPDWRRAVPAGLAAVLVAAYLIFLSRYVSPYAGGADSSGYLNSARLLGQGKFMAPARIPAGHTATEFGGMAVVPLGFRLAESGDQMVPTYPIGLPLHLLAASWIAGWAHAGQVVNLLTVLACGALVWAFARWLAVPPLCAAGAVLLLWLCPLFLFSAVQPMSDLLALGWTLAALYGALRAREHVGWAVAAGVAFGLAVMVRPTNALLIVPLAVALGLNLRAWAAVIGGALPSVAFVAYYSWRVYGSPLTTGYGDVSSSFSRAFLPHNLQHFGHWIPTLLSPLVVLALAAPWVPAGRRRAGAVLAAWFMVLTGFYAFYYHSGETWWYLRFILPAFPALILLAMAVLAAAGNAVKSRPAGLIVTGVLLAGAGYWQARQIAPLDVLNLKRNERSYPDAARWAQQNLPANSAVYCMQVSGAFFYYTDFLLLRWERIDPDKNAALLAAVAHGGRPVYAALFEFETPAALERIGGHWNKLSTVGQVTFWQRLP